MTGLRGALADLADAAYDVSRGATRAVLAPSREPGLVLVVTGASSGIGEAVAGLAARERHHLVLVARREEVLDDVADAARAAGAASATVVVADMAEDDEVAAAMTEALSRHGRIDAVLHCAGVVSYGRTERTAADDFAAVVRTNLLGAASVARHAVPVLRRQRSGTLVLVGSLLGHIAVPEMTPYVVSKWGVRALARQLAIENIDEPGVHVVHVAPGSVDTPIYQRALDDGGAEPTPPPPTQSAGRVAESVLDAIGSRRASVQTSALNYGLIAMFRLAPAVWDRTVGPAFDLLSRRG